MATSQRKLILYVLLLAAIVVVVLLLTRPREPVYKGKTWSQWLADVDYGQPEATRIEAAKAIKEIGTNLLPKLVADLRGNRLDVWKWRASVLLKKQPFLNISFTTPDERARRATWGFNTLGSTAKPVAPDLLELFNSHPGYALHAYAAVLGPEAIPVLITRLTSTNVWVRSNAASALFTFSPAEAQEAIPLLIKGLNDTDTNVRFNMGLALQKLDPVAYEKAIQTNR